MTIEVVNELELELSEEEKKTIHKAGVLVCNLIEEIKKKEMNHIKYVKDGECIFAKRLCDLEKACETLATVEYANKIDINNDY